ncbi:hypothetical protein VZ94_07655, partial [Methylocucumis oryzae]
HQDCFCAHFMARASFSVLGRRALYERLCGNLVVDMTKTCEDLAWHPITPGRNALLTTVARVLR